MTNINTLKFSCSSPSQLIEYSHEIVTALPDGPRQRFREILVDYRTKYTVADVFNRLNNRTIYEIFREYEASTDARDVVESGELDGVHYTLYEAPGESESSCSGDESPTE
jgi:hypothetical protein